MDQESSSFGHRRLAMGLCVSALGIVLARANWLLLGEGSPYRSAAYLVGVFLGLAGLVVVASSIKRSPELMVQCPHCAALNRSDAQRCARCRRALAEP